MNCSTKEKQAGRIEREINADGVEYDQGSVFERFGQLTDIRKAQGKRYSLETVLTIMVMAKLCGCDRPMEIAEWAQKPSGTNYQVIAIEATEATSLQHVSTDFGLRGL